MSGDNLIGRLTWLQPFTASRVLFWSGLDGR
jgi:hypothetical protein